MIDLGLKSWTHIRKYVIKRWRDEKSQKHLARKSRYANAVNPNLEDNPIYPSPDEFLAFVAWNLRGKADPHWTPQYRLCPFCEAQYDVYAKMEELDVDSEYFLLKTDASERIATRQFVNPSLQAKRKHLKPQLLSEERIEEKRRNDVHRERRFWAEASDESVFRMLKVFHVDFVMFNYSVVNYFNALDLGERLGDLYKLAEAKKSRKILNDFE